MMKHVGLYALLTLLCTVVTRGLDVTPSGRQILSSLKHAFPFPQPKDQFLEYVPRGDVERGSWATPDSNRRVWRRRLQQTEVKACFWNNDDETCDLSLLAVSPFLEAADNDVADFLKSRFDCYVLRDKDSCVDADCEWHNDFCYQQHEAYREFHSVKCMEDVNALVDVRAGRAECSRKATEYACRAADRCSWDGDECLFDRWYYFFGLRSEGRLPAESEDVVIGRNAEIMEGVTTGLENGEIANWGDLLDWDPPPLKCPPTQKQVVCDYVDSLTPFFVHSLYCSLQYDSEIKLPDCDHDAYCSANLESATPECQASPAKLRPVFAKGEEVFAKAIDDPEARKFEMQRAECVAVLDADDCDDADGCTWLDGSNLCAISQSWIDNEVYEIVGEEKDPVCQYFSLSVRYGCASIGDKDKCNEDSRCYYDEDLEFCDIGIRGQMEFALSLSDAEDAFLDAGEICADAKTEKTCVDIIALPIKEGGPKKSKDPKKKKTVINQLLPSERDDARKRMMQVASSV